MELRRARYGLRIPEAATVCFRRYFVLGIAFLLLKNGGKFSAMVQTGMQVVSRLTLESQVTC